MNGVVRLLFFPTLPHWPHQVIVLPGCEACHCPMSCHASSKSIQTPASSVNCLSACSYHHDCIVYSCSVSASGVTSSGLAHSQALMTGAQYSCDTLDLGGLLRVCQGVLACVVLYKAYPAARACSMITRTTAAGAWPLRICSCISLYSPVFPESRSIFVVPVATKPAFATCKFEPCARHSF